MGNFFTLSFCLLSGILFAQTDYQSKLSGKAFEEAIDAAENALKKTPRDSMAIYVIGVSHTHLGNTAKAIEYLEKAQEFGVAPLPIKYNLAKNYAVMQEKDKAMDLLQEIADAGGARFDKLEDKEFVGWADEKRFKEIKKQMYFNARPCEADENYRRFDFWVGEWDVFAGGAKVADSKISHSNDKCGILEDYKTFGVFAGNSITYYDKADKKWKQNWVASGSVTHFTEADKPYDGDLCFLSQSINPQGKIIQSKMTFYNNSNGSVRQHLEFSNDGGNTWSTNFDGLYTRKEKKGG